MPNTNELINKAIEFIDDLQSSSGAHDTFGASLMIRELVDHIVYLTEMDKATESKLAICRKLNANYKQHVIKLMDDTNILRSDLLAMTESKLGGL